VSTSRETARDALVTLLGTALVGAGLPVKTVTGSKVDSLEGLTPLVSVLSSGSMRKRQTFQGNDATFYFEVQVWVKQESTGWTNAQAEDALDRIESLIAATYEAAQSTDEWEDIYFSGRTNVMEVTVAGNSYYMERIPTITWLAKS